MSLNATTPSRFTGRSNPHLSACSFASLGAHKLRRSSDSNRMAAAAATVPGSLPDCAKGTLQRIIKIDEIMDQCQVVLLDQFGVLHDGKQPYPQAVAAVGRLAAAGKQILVLSNSSRRSGGTIGKLEKMGFNASWFAGAITSGELTHQFLSLRPDPWWQQLGRRCLHLTWSTRGNISLSDLDLEIVVEPSQADFILAHGTEALGLPDGSTRDASVVQLQQLLEQCVQHQQQQQQQADGGSNRRALPMVVANPDLVTVDGPSLITMPGTLAHFYKQIGGEVQLMGKPSPVIYTAAQQMLQQLGSTSPAITSGSTVDDSSSSSSSFNSDARRWLAIGDSLEHDIAGAAAAGIKTLFIVGGIHALDVQLQDCNGNSNWSDAAMQQLCEQHGATPDYCMAYLQ